MITTSSMADLFGFLTQLMTEHASIFEGMGSHLFRGFAVILIVWFGAKTALASAGSGSEPLFHFDHFAALLMTIAFGFGMVTYYSHSIPGIGISFYHLIIDEGQNLANQLNHALVQELWDRMSAAYQGLETPGLSLAFNIVELLRYAITALVLEIAP